MSFKTNPLALHLKWALQAMAARNPVWTEGEGYTAALHALEMDEGDGLLKIAPDDLHNAIAAAYREGARDDNDSARQAQGKRNESIDYATKALGELMKPKPAPAVVAWVLVDKDGNPDPEPPVWRKSDGPDHGNWTERAANRRAPDRAPFRWAPLVLGEVKQ